MPTTWLTSGRALLLVDREPGDVREQRWAGVLDGAKAFVQRRRPELFTDDAPRPISADVKLGTAMLAARLYDRGATPLGVGEYAETAGTILRYDPDIGRLLGIGTEGSFNFGAGVKRGA